MKLCVIGAGAAGLCAARHGAQFGYEVTVFEKSSEIGGTWVYTDETGKDKNGLDVHSSMYQGLYTNLPKEIMGFPDFSVPTQENSYIKSEDILEFFNKYANHFDVHKSIRFEHHVQQVRPLDDNKWEVIVKNMQSGEQEVHSFDCLLICNGHYSTPIIPKLDGSDLYQGNVIHSHDYRSTELFADETVLVIGAGPSGYDLTRIVSKVATRVTLSHHLKEKPITDFLPNVIQKPDVVRLTKEGAIFADGSNQSFSIIFYCTGYKYSFPFLSEDCGVSFDDNYVRPLFKHCLSIHRPSLGFIGLPFYVCAFQMFDLQTRFCLTFMSQRKVLPTTEEMLADTERKMNEHFAKGFRKHQAHLMGEDQFNYYQELSTTANLEPLKPVIAKLHNFSSRRFVEDLSNFRYEIFRLLDDETFVKVNGVGGNNIKKKLHM